MRGDTVESTTVPAIEFGDDHDGKTPTTWTVSGVSIESHDRRRGWIPSIDKRMARLSTPLEDLLEFATGTFERAERICLVPDAHYPFHPSTGLVTDPAVVGAIVAVLESRTNADIVVVGADTEFSSFDRTATYLGYPRVLDRVDATLVTPEQLAQQRSIGEKSQSSVDTVPTQYETCTAEGPIGSRETTTQSSVGETIPVRDGGNSRTGSTVDARHIGTDHGQSTHRSIVDSGVVSDNDGTAAIMSSCVIPVPSLRPTNDGSVAGAYRTLAHVLGRSRDNQDRNLDRIRACNPPLSILDATVAFDNRPRVLDVLFAGNPPAVDALGSTLLGQSPEEDPLLSAEFGSRQHQIRVDGVDVASLKAVLSDGKLPVSSDPHPLVSTAYRVYARLSGDAVPPQLDGKNGKSASTTTEGD